MPKLFIFDAFTLLIREKTVANYALLRCKTFSLKICLGILNRNIRPSWLIRKT